MKSSQSNRLWDYLLAHPNQDIPQPELNRIAAGPDGVYVTSISRRISDCRAKARELGGDLVKSRDEWVNGSRHTWYRYLPPVMIKVSHENEKFAELVQRELNQPDTLEQIRSAAIKRHVHGILYGC